jgi:inosine-uridine nucleoside N-ribohydrolase
MSAACVFLVLFCVGWAARPVIFDTDSTLWWVLLANRRALSLDVAVGSDFDDSAAIAVALSDPELDVKLIVCPFSGLK